MSRPPPEEYLDPAFDPSKLTISTICSILSSHDIELPVSKHRKEFYVELFNAKLKPRQQEILQSILDIVPSDDGIIKVSDPSNFDFGLESDEEVVVSGSDIDVSEEKTDGDFL